MNLIEELKNLIVAYERMGKINEKGMFVGQLARFFCDCKALLEKYEAEQAQVLDHVPDGWKLVPVEPTTEMLIAGAEKLRVETTALNKAFMTPRIYNAMLEAAPQPPVLPTIDNEPVAYVLRGEFVPAERMYLVSDRSAWTPLYTRPGPSATFEQINERAEFEKWFHPTKQERIGDYYANGEAQDAWEGWQARAFR